MADIEYLHLCEDAYRDAQNRVSVFGIVSDLAFSHLPAHASVKVAMQVRNSTTDRLPLRLQWLAPSSEPVHVRDLMVDTEADGSAFVVLTLGNVTLREDGRYMLRVSSAGRPLWSGAIAVRIAGADAP